MIDQDTANYFKTLDAVPPLTGTFSSAASGIPSANADGPPLDPKALESILGNEAHESSKNNTQSLDTLLSGSSPPQDVQGWEDMINRDREAVGLKPDYKAPQEWRPKSSGPGM